MSLNLRSMAVALVGWFLLLVGGSTPTLAAPSGPPVRIGATLALTGPFAGNTGPHKLVAEIYVEQLNKKNGLLGRPVEYVLIDDQGKPDLTRTLYERLLTVDKVDLIVGPWGTAANFSAIGVAERYGRIILTNTFLPGASSYEMHFPTQGAAVDFVQTYPNKVFDALAAAGKPPKTMAIVTGKFPSVQTISIGARELAAKRGVNVALYLEYEAGTRDFGPVAVRIKEANPDFIWVGALGLDGNLLLEALKKIDYTPKGHLYLFPANGPLARAPEAKYALMLAVFGAHPPFTDRPGIAEFVKTFNERAAKVGLPYPQAEHNAATAYATWQVLDAGVTGAKSLEDKAIAAWLKGNRVETIMGTQRFDGPKNHGPELSKIAQLQDGKWIVVYPKEWAAPGARLVYPSP